MDQRKDKGSLSTPMPSTHTYHSPTHQHTSVIITAEMQQRWYYVQTHYYGSVSTDPHAAIAGENRPTACSKHVQTRSVIPTWTHLSRRNPVPPGRRAEWCRRSVACFALARAPSPECQERPRSWNCLASSRRTKEDGRIRSFLLVALRRHVCCAEL